MIIFTRGFFLEFLLFPAFNLVIKLKQLNKLPSNASVLKLVLVNSNLAYLSCRRPISIEWMSTVICATGELGQNHYTSLLSNSHCNPLFVNVTLGKVQTHFKFYSFRLEKFIMFHELITTHCTRAIK